MMNAIWLSWRELINRKFSLITGLIVVSIAVSLCAYVELIARAKEVRVALEISAIGPSLRLIPKQVTAVDMAGSHFFDQRILSSLKESLQGKAMFFDNRYLYRTRLDIGTIPLVGVEPENSAIHTEIFKELTEQTVIIGPGLQERLNWQLGDTLPLQNTTLKIAGVLPQSTSIDDFTIFMDIHTLRKLLKLPDGVFSEVRVYPRPGVKPDELMSFIEGRFPDINVINTYRGKIAEEGMQESLSRYRRALYAVVALIVTLAIAIWSYLNASERKSELATLSAIGSTNLTILGVLLSRAVLVGFCGAILGYVASLVIVLTQDFQAGIYVDGIFHLAGILILGATLISAFGAVPVSLIMLRQNHVKLFQE